MHVYLRMLNTLWDVLLLHFCLGYSFSLVLLSLQVLRSHLRK